jgi:hypothetical protein
MAEKSIPDVREQYDRLNSKLVQLTALLQMTYGNARETFTDMSEDLQDRYMWACASMARESEELAEALGTRLYQLEGAEAVSRG